MKMAYNLCINVSAMVMWRISNIGNNQLMAISISVKNITGESGSSCRQ